VQTRYSAEQKAAVLRIVDEAVARTGWRVRRVLKRLGIPRSVYYEWRDRALQKRLDDLVPGGRCLSAVLPEEKEAVITYALAHPKDGYRRLAWMMVDADVAYLSPASVYRILTDADLLYRWKRSCRSGEKPEVPTRPHQRWHTDIMYLRVGDVWYFLVTVLDGFSRYVVHWELLTSMRAADVRLVIQHALEANGLKDVEIVSDNGSQFTSADFKALVRQFELQHIRIRTYHPESNGTLERFHRSTREALADDDLRNLARARELIGRWIEHYNENRLHASLQYLPPCEFYRGNPTERIAERRAKLERGRRHREIINRQRLEKAA
jgi:transposase InsO family protein